ncbi:transglycosylase domain-containing protein, partial [Candidatus Amesbacteria bacterium]|nr:transglycosylase domain-containing protein [Candidatus Amesbacteria bacterium]
MKLWTEIASVLVAIGKPVYWIVFKWPKWQGNRIRNTKKVKNIKIIYSARKKSRLKNILKKIYLVKTIQFSIKIPTPKLPKLNLALSVFGILTLVIGIYVYVFRGLPSPTTLTTKPVPLTTHIRDRNGTTLYKLYKNENRTMVSLPEIPLFVRQATIAIEDKEFYRHSGFSVTGTVRAFWRNLNGKPVEGGSTITQQLVKTALLSPERTLQRKVRELVLAIAVELLYSKDQILEMYLNRVSYGGESYGVEEAAQSYFNKAARDLTLSEAALLAGLPASPTTFSPFGARPELAKSRQKEVLRRMSEDKFITWEQAQKASEETLVFATPRIDIKAPHFVMYVKELLALKYGSEAVEQGGLDITTSLDLDLQEKVQRIVFNETAKVAYLRIGNGAALVTNPTTGEILAMVGSRDYFDVAHDGNVNVTRALRQPGSSIKPVNYALALMHNFTPGTLIEDAPITYKTPGQPNYSPVNYDGKWHGKVPLRTALGSSYNIPAVKVLAANGVDNMIALAQEMGITTWNDPSRFGLSLTLGGGEVTMLDMATAYGVFANSGSKVNLHSILIIRDSNGKILEKLSEYPATKVMDSKI